jgi:hypothetical protein
MNTNFILLITSLVIFSTQVFSKTSGFPADEIIVAIEKAKAYVIKEKIDVSGCFIQKVEFKNQYEELVPQFWEITFIKVPKAKGGYIIVHVNNDGTVKVFYGE